MGCSLHVRKRSGERSSDPPGGLEWHQGPCAPVWKGLSVTLPRWELACHFPARGSRKAGLVTAFHEGPQTVSPDVCRFFVSTQPLMMRTFRLAGSSPQCPYLGKVQNLVKHPPPVVGGDHWKEPGGGGGSGERGWPEDPAAQGDCCLCFSQCTASCGGGVQTRSVQCLAGGRPASGCFVQQKPAASQACNTHFCPVAKKRGECGSPWA